MSFLRNCSIRTKLIVIILALTVWSLIFAFSIFVYKDLDIFRKDLVRNFTVLASTVGVNSRAALVFEDPEGAKRILSSLKEELQILCAAIYDAENNVFVTYTENSKILFEPPTVLKVGQFVYTDHTDILQPIMHDGDVVGKIYLRAHMKEFDKRLETYLIVSGLIFVVTLGFTVVFTLRLQSIISKPILSLAETAKEISKTTDYSIRVQYSSEDELGTLYSGFNDMLEKIEKRENELAEHRGNLEGLVEKRTLDLAKVINKLGDLNELKNKFLGIASHDLRNPIYVIRSYSEILRDSTLGPVNEKQLKLLDKIFDNSEFMRGLLDNLLDISKIESGTITINKDQNDFNDLTINQIEIHQLLAHKKDISLHFGKEEVLPFDFDRNAISQVMSNYIGNAIKFAPLESHVYITTKTLGERVQFSIKDEGPGISNEDQKLLFGEFQTLSAKPTGGEKSTGLGLAIAKKLVNLHGGDVGVISEVGRGATFFFTLPAGN